MNSDYQKTALSLFSQVEATTDPLSKSKLQGLAISLKSNVTKTQNGKL